MSESTRGKPSRTRSTEPVREMARKSEKTIPSSDDIMMASDYIEKYGLAKGLSDIEVRGRKIRFIRFPDDKYFRTEKKAGGPGVTYIIGQKLSNPEFWEIAAIDIDPGKVEADRPPKEIYIDRTSEGDAKRLMNTTDFVLPRISRWGALGSREDRSEEEEAELKEFEAFFEKRIADPSNTFAISEGWEVPSLGYKKYDVIYFIEHEGNDIGAILDPRDRSKVLKWDYESFPSVVKGEKKFPRPDEYSGFKEDEKSGSREYAEKARDPSISEKDRKAFEEMSEDEARHYRMLKEMEKK